jgi:hypothetical protein
MTLRGLPHSEIVGLKVVSTYPTLIAGYHVLRRLLVPRHPPYALCSLTKNLYWFTQIDITRSLSGTDHSRCIFMLQKEHFLGFSSLFSTPLFGQRLVRVKQASVDNY